MAAEFYVGVLSLCIFHYYDWYEHTGSELDADEGHIFRTAVRVILFISFIPFSSLHLNLTYRLSYDRNFCNTK